MTARGRDSAARLLLAAVVVVVAWSFAHVIEDAFISFRYARNLANGHGLVFNPGEAEPVEGYSNLLWTLIAAAVIACGGDPVAWMPVFAGACAVALADTAFGVARRAGAGTEAALAGALVVVATGTFGVWATSGLETMAHALLLLAAYDAVARADGRRGLVGAGLLGLGLLTIRTEGWAWVGVVAVAGGVARRQGGRAVLPGVAALLVPAVLASVPLSLWRLATYGTLVASTTAVKLHVGPETLLRGLRQTVHLGLTLLAPLLVLPALALLLRPRWRAALTGPALLLGAVLAFVLLVGGDYMAFYRFHAAALGPAIVLLAALFQELEERQGRVALRAVAAAAVLVAALPSVGIHLVPAAARVRVNFRGDTDQATLLSERERLLAELSDVADRRRKAALLVPHLQPGDSYVWGAVGAFGWYAPELTLLDPFGLTNKAARDAGTYRPGRAGHEQRVDRSFFETPTILRFRAFDRGTPRARFEAWEDEIRALDEAGAYGPEAWPTDDGGTLVLARRLEDPTGREAAWEAWRASVGEARRRR